MEDKFTAVYIMVRAEELTQEDQGSYAGALARQEKECLEFLKARTGGTIEGHVEVYKSRGQLLMDVERNRIGRLVVESIDRLGATKADVEAIRFELEMSGIEVLSVSGK